MEVAKKSWVISLTHSVVMTTLHSQSCTRSLSDSALKPANTAEWTAPILAQARKAAAACHVIGRLERQHAALPTE